MDKKFQNLTTKNKSSQLGEEIENPTVLIVVPVHNNGEILKKCIDSIYGHTEYKNFNVTIVDDCSDEKNVNILKDLKKQYCIKIITLPYRHHYAAACNVGIRSEQADYYILLNSDTIIGSECWLEKIVECCTKYPECGIFSVLSNRALAQSIPYPDNTTPDIWGHIVDQESMRQCPPHQMCHGFCYIISKKAIKICGLLDEDKYPHYGVEDSYSMRCAFNSICGRLIDSVFIYHQGSSSYTKKFKDNATTQATKVLFAEWDKGNIQMQPRCDISSLIKRLDKYCHKEIVAPAVDYIIPCCNLGSEYFNERMCNLQNIVDNFLVRQKTKVRLILVEQILDSKRERFIENLHTRDLEVKKIVLESPVFCKGWLYNNGIRRVRSKYFILGELDVIVDNDPTYCAKLVNWCITNNFSWAFGWNSLIYLSKDKEEYKDNFVRVSPQKGESEGGIVIFAKRFWDKYLYGCDERYKWLGGPDNELAFRAHKLSGKYESFPYTVYHLWHSRCWPKDSKILLKANREKYAYLIKKDNWKIVNDRLSQCKLGEDLQDTQI